MGKKSEKKKAGKPAQAVAQSAPRRIRYDVRHTKSAGPQGPLSVVEISDQGESVIARYHTMDTARWVRDVMQAAIKA